MQDSTVLITSKQLKVTNLIFAEHNKLLLENKLLKDQLDNYILENSILTETDSIRYRQILTYSSLSNSHLAEIENLNLQIKKKETTILIWKVSGITVSTCLFLWLLAK